jgi:hypothetical protein
MQAAICICDQMAAVVVVYVLTDRTRLGASWRRCSVSNATLHLPHAVRVERLACGITRTRQPWLARCGGCPWVSRHASKGEARMSASFHQEEAEA